MGSDGLAQPATKPARRYRRRMTPRERRQFETIRAVAQRLIVNSTLADELADLIHQVADAAVLARETQDRSAELAYRRGWVDGRQAAADTAAQLAAAEARSRGRWLFIRMRELILDVMPPWGTQKP